MVSSLERYARCIVQVRATSTSSFVLFKSNFPKYRILLLVRVVACYFYSTNDSDCESAGSSGVMSDDEANSDLFHIRAQSQIYNDERANSRRN